MLPLVHINKTLQPCHPVFHRSKKFSLSNMSNVQMAPKAVELKKLIEFAHKYLPAVGKCLSLELEYKREYWELDDEEDEEDDEDEEDEDGRDDEDEDVEEEEVGEEENAEDAEDDAKDVTVLADPGLLDRRNPTTTTGGGKPSTRTLEKLQDKLGRIYASPGFKMAKEGYEDETIHVLGEKIQLSDISLDHIEEWRAAARVSGFGNVAKQETQHDTNVRSSRELDITQFDISEKMIKDVARTWGQHFLPRSVTVQPYKILIYGPGDHFQFHQDTPEENLCGTFLISLYEECHPSWTFELHQHGKSNYWSSYKNGFCAFYPDIPHRVNPITSGYRAILSLKIFAQKQETSEWTSNHARKMELESLAEELQKINVPIGLILNHHYGYESKSIYGCDKLLLDALKNKGFHIDWKPVLIRFSGQGRDPCNDDYEHAYVKSKVYLITDDALNYVRERLAGTREKDSFEYDGPKKIIFLDGEFGNNQYVRPWSEEEMQEIEYTGNESQPHSRESVYVRYAAIVMSTQTESPTD